MKLTITKDEFCTILDALQLTKEIQLDGGDQRRGEKCEALLAKLGAL